MRAKRLVASVFLLTLAASAGWLLHYGVHTPDPGSRTEAPLASAIPGEEGARRRRPDFTLGDLKGVPRAVGEWDGKVLLLNFWATWCPPCRIEIPELIALQEQYRDQGLQIVGIAIDEPQSTKDYVEAAGINYPTLTGAQDAIEVAVDYGNAIGALPYTVLVDREGGIAYTRQGQLDRRDAEDMILDLLARPQ